MVAAAAAAGQGCETVLIEKNNRLGAKLCITGKGRCNITNEVDTAGLMQEINSNPRFLYSALKTFDSHSVMGHFQALGVPLKTERGRCVFPVSDKASDVVAALEKDMRDKNVAVKKNCAVDIIDSKDSRIMGVRAGGTHIGAKSVIIATGGLSYPITGSTGDGYKFAKSLGHTVAPTYPSLVPLVVKEPWVANLEGLSLKNTGIKVLDGAGKVLYKNMGEMLFTSKGISGPIALSASRFVTGRGIGEAVIAIDLKPALSHEKLDLRLQRDFSENINKDFGNALNKLLPRLLIDTIIALSGIPAGKKVHNITKQERIGLGKLLKGIIISPVGTEGYEKAIITMGGVNTKEINPSTMMSKIVDGLYFAGEVLDVDAMTGGYNLQIAFSTGYLAGISAAKQMV